MMNSKSICPYCNGTGQGSGSIREAAEALIDLEKRLDDIYKEKEKLQTKRPWFPWRLKLVRK